MAQQLEITRLSSKGQLVIPKKMREKLNWKAGERVAVQLIGNQLVLRKLSLNDILKEADKDWEKGDTVRLWPQEE